MERQNNRCYVFVISVILLIFVGILFFYFQSPKQKLQDDHINIEAADTAVVKYFHAFATGNDSEAAKYREFADEQERKDFKDRLRLSSLMGTGMLDHTREPHLVRTTETGDCIEAIYLLPVRRGSYIPQMVSVRKVEGRPKIEIKTLPKFGQEWLAEWEMAKGDYLSEKAQTFKRQIRWHIDALKYAKKKELEITPKREIEAEIDFYNDIKNLKPEQLRSYMIDKIEYAIEKFAPPERD